MHHQSSSSPPPQPRPPPTTYTTIPISAGDVIYRSFQNVHAAVSRHRPWPEFLSSGGFTRPDSLSSAVSRLRTNTSYFLVNYAVVVSACGALSLIGSPFSLLIFALLFLLWLVLYFFREDPLALWGHHVGDRVVLAGMVLCSVLVVWFSGSVWNLVVGIGIGVLICGVHGSLRTPDGLFLDEEQAASRGLIGSGGSGPPELPNKTLNC